MTFQRVSEAFFLFTAQVTIWVSAPFSYHTFFYFTEFKERKVFDLFDKNGDGHISAAELGKVLRAIGQNPTDKDVEEVLKKADKDGKVLRRVQFKNWLCEHLEWSIPICDEIMLSFHFSIFSVHVIISLCTIREYCKK